MLRNDIEIKLWKLSACIKRKFYCSKISPNRWPFSLQAKTLTEESKEIKISCIKFFTQCNKNGNTSEKHIIILKSKRKRAIHIFV